MTQLAYAPRRVAQEATEITDADVRRGLTQGADQSGDGLWAMALLWAMFHGDSNDA